MTSEEPGQRHQSRRRLTEMQPLPNAC